MLGILVPLRRHLINSSENLVAHWGITFVVSEPMNSSLRMVASVI